MGAQTASSSAALSRTEVVRTCWTDSGYANPSPIDAPGTLPRDGLKPKRPHIEDGMRIDPPPSLPCATGTIPDATAAAEPPLDPPGECVVRHVLRVGPCSNGSV